MTNKICLFCKYVNPVNGKCIILGKKIPESVTGCPVKEAREKKMTNKTCGECKLFEIDAIAATAAKLKEVEK